MTRAYSFLKKAISSCCGISIPHWTSLLVWSIGVIFMIAFTIKDLYPTVKNYFDEDENVAVKILVQRNDTIQQPQLFACLGLPSTFGNSYYLEKFAEALLSNNRSNDGSFGDACTECDALTNHSWNVWDEMTERINSQLQTENVSVSDPQDAVEVLRDFWKEKLLSQNLTDFLADDSHEWQKPLLDTSIDIVRNIFFTDRLIYSHRAIGVTQEPFHEALIEKLFEKILKYLLPNIKLTDGSGGEGWVNFITIDQAMLSRASLKGNSLCFPIPYTDLDTDDFCMETNFDPGSPWYSAMPTEFMEILSEDPTYDWEIPELYRSGDVSGKQVEVSFKYSVSSVVREQRQHVKEYCYNDRSRMDCLNRCKTDIILKGHGCAPFTARALVPRENFTLPWCNSELYDHFSLRNPRGKFQSCQEKCSYACEYAFYQWESTASTRDATEESFSICFEPVVTPYLEFIQQYKDGPNDFISQVGGVLNFYLGLSGLSVILIFILLMDCIRTRNEPRKTATQNAPAASILGVQWRLMARAASARPDSESSSGDALKSNMEKMEANIHDLQESVRSLAGIVQELRDTMEIMRNRNIQYGLDHSATIEETHI